MPDRSVAVSAQRSDPTGKAYSDLSAALDHSWRMLAHSFRHFEPISSVAPAASDDVCFAVPITHAGDDTRRALLHIPHEELCRLSAAMFDAPPESMTTELCNDAGKELCNVLSACCIKGLPELDGGEIGVPDVLKPGTVHTMTATCTPWLCFVSSNNAGAISLCIVTDPHSPQEQDKHALSDC